MNEALQKRVLSETSSIPRERVIGEHNEIIELTSREIQPYDEVSRNEVITGQSLYQGLDRTTREDPVVYASISNEVTNSSNVVNAINEDYSNDTLPISSECYDAVRFKGNLQLQSVSQP
jgi:hypothetical protein